MQTLNQALDDVKGLYVELLGQPVPEIESKSYVSFPAGVDPVDFAIREAEQLKHLTKRMALAPQPYAWVPPADMFVSDDTVLVRLEVPGVAREDLKVFVADGECVVRGDRKGPDGIPELRPLAIERPWGPFERRFTLPAGCVPDRVTARYAEGVLELKIAIEEKGIEGEKEVEVA